MIAATLGLAGSSVAVAVGRDHGRPQPAAAAVTDPSAAARPGATDRSRYAGPKSAHSPRPGDPVGVRRTSLAGRLQAALNRQAAALLAGDEGTFVGIADPALAPELHRRFADLRALRVTGWEETLAGDPQPVPDPSGVQRWRVAVRVRYCFAEPDCVPAPLTNQTEWADDGDGEPRLVALRPSEGGEAGPRPWEVSDLRVVAGNRVIVAAPAPLAGRLSAALATAEQAAAVTDRYARWGPPPGRYLVFFAGPDEWTRWYGVHEPSWVAGYAQPVGDWSTEVIMNAQRLGTGDDVLLDTLRHEFTHVVTLAGVRRDYSTAWWLVEGMAEYVRMVGRPLDEYTGLAATHRYVHSGHWTGDIALTVPADGASLDDATGRYGVAMLALRRIAGRYGEDKLLAFFAAVVRDGTDPVAAAPAVLGADWASVAADCAWSVRRDVA